MSNSEITTMDKDGNVEELDYGHKQVVLLKDLLETLKDFPYKAVATMEMCGIDDNNNPVPIMHKHWWELMNEKGEDGADACIEWFEKYFHGLIEKDESES